jgi:serine/threonine protein kinase
MQAGTPAFQPPEQLRGEMVGVGSDVYALGCIVLEVFSEQQLWEGLSPHTIILKVAGGSFPSTAHVGADIKTLIDKCFVPVGQRISISLFLQGLCDLF